MPGNIYQYPLQNDAKNRLWVRFKQVDFELSEVARTENGDLARNEDGSVVHGGNVLETRTQNTDACYLYLPPSLQFADEASYNQEGIGVLGRAAELAIQGGALGAGNDIQSAVTGTLDIMSGALVDTIRVGETIASGDQAVPGAILSRILQSTPLRGGSIERGVRSSLRYTANPHLRSTFDNVGIRNFNFDFEFLPDSREEAKHMNSIVKFFRKNLYPEYYHPEDDADISSEILRAAGDLVYHFPSMLKIDMFYKMEDSTVNLLNENSGLRTAFEEGIRNLQDQDAVDEFDAKEFLSSGLLRVGPRLQYCYIQNVRSTYDSPNAQAFRPDGNPVGMKLSVSVTEDRTLHKGMIERGF